MRNSFLIFIILVALAFAFSGKNTAESYIHWEREGITYETDIRYKITLYPMSAEAPVVYDDVTKYNTNTSTLVFQTTNEVVRFNGNYVIENL